MLAAPGSEPSSLVPSGLQALPGIRGGLPRALQVYRSHAVALADRALTAIYPRLRDQMEAQAAGSFAALAWACWRLHAPAQADLGDWGEALIGMLARARAEQGLPATWPALARLEWAMHRVERLADVSPDLGSLALLGRLPAGAVRVVLSRQVELLRCDDIESREVLSIPEEAFGQGPREALIVWRDGWKGSAMALDAAALRWYEALDEGLDLERSLLAAGPGFDFIAWLPAAVTRGWLACIETAGVAAVMAPSSVR
ncbi:hypothetical protein [Roseateles aquatilis]|uniref:hypothetical protein n=1 Tax=Roseateles aquatilis TaxID=431061 RepID=UPI00112FFF07|nr:hypothetical protein [Roseateles aquatilis]